MSDILTSALPDAQYDGAVLIAGGGLRGMITLRGDLSASRPIATAIAEFCSDMAVPGPRGVAQSPAGTALRMSPDELLLILPYGRAAELAALMSQRLQGEFATVANVSDARAVFTLTGPRGRDVLGKLCPVDMLQMTSQHVRRTRIAQVAAAFWLSGPDEITLICFRSVADYVFDLLRTAAIPEDHPRWYYPD